MNSEQQPSKKLSILEQILRENAGPNATPEVRTEHLFTQPDLQGEFAYGPNNTIEISFGEKFEEDFQGWENGERVKTTYRVVKKIGDDGKNEYALQVSESVVGDIRHSDTFYLDGLTPEDEHALATAGMANVDAVVQVKRQLHPDYQISNMQDYTASLIRIIDVQKPWDGAVETLQENQKVLLEGEVVSYEEDREYPYTSAVITLKMTNGQIIPVALGNGYLDFEDGVLEKFFPKNPTVGDTVQMNTTYGRLSTYKKVADIGFYAYFCRSTFLMKPARDRQILFDAERQYVSGIMEKMETAQSPIEVRQIVAAIVRATTLNGRDSTLTRAEIKKIEKLIDEKIPDEAEKPLDIFADMYSLQSVERAYGVNPYEMSRREFLDFCFQVAHGEKNVVGDGAPDSPWMVMQNNIPTEIAKQVLTESITSLYPRVIGKRLIMREDILVDPEDLPDIRTKSYGHRVGHKVVVGKQNYTPEQLANSDTVTWADKYLFDQSLQYLTSHIGVDTSTIFIALTKKMYEEDLFWVL